MLESFHDKRTERISKINDMVRNQNTFVIVVSSDRQEYYRLYDSVVDSISIREHMSKDMDVQKGDLVFFVLLHYWHKGVCGCGEIESIEIEDGHKYTWITFKQLVDPKNDGVLSLELLHREMPNIDWHNFQDGFVLSESDRNKLEYLWDDYLKEHHITRVGGMTLKASSLSFEASAFFDIGDDYKLDLLHSYHVFLCACDDDILDSFTINKCNDKGEDPEIILIPKKELPFKMLHITVRGFEFEDGHIIKYDSDKPVWFNRDKGRECVNYILDNRSQL